MHKLKKYTKNRPALILSLSSAIAQGIQFLALPFISRLFEPEQYGIYILYQSVIAVVSVLATLRFEYVAVQAIGQRISRSSLQLILVASFTTSLCILLLYSLSRVFDVRITGMETYLVIILVTTLPVYAVYQFLYMRSSALDSFAQMAIARISGAIITVFIMLGAGYFIDGSSIYLISAAVSGFLIQVFILHSALPEKLWSKFKITDIIAVFRKYKKLTLTLVPSGLLDRLSQYLHILFTGNVYPGKVAAGIGMHNRMILTPSGIITQAVADVFRAKSARLLADNQECRSLFLWTGLKLLLMAILPYFLIQFYSAEFFSLVLGSEWSFVGTYSTILAPQFLIGFIVSPLSTIIYISKRPELDLYITAVSVPVSLTALITGAAVSGPELAIIFYTATQCLKYLVEGTLSYFLATGSL